VSGPGALGRAAVAAVAALIVGGPGCALFGRGHAGAGGGAPADVRIVLYRDRALVDEPIDAVVRDHRAVLPLPLGVGPAELVIVGDGARVVAWSAAAADGQRDVAAVAGPRTTRGRLLGVDETGVALLDGDVVHLVGGVEILAGAVRPAVEVEVEGGDGRRRFHLRYATDRLPWQASYTLVDHAGRARLRGALTVDNQTGRRWQRAAIAVVDGPAPDPIAGGGAPPPPARMPGRYAIEPGPQRLELALRDRTLAVGSLLVFDPVGASLDHPTNPPESDPGYGVRRWPAALDETVKIDLAAVADVALPAGPVRLATVLADGALRWQGEGKLLPPAADAERYLTVAIGDVDDVRGARQRTDFVRDDAGQRLVEEIRITLTSTRATAVEVLVREHMYRGPCWTLAYHSTGDGVAKEGEQQIALTTTVPPAGTTTVMYRVVYHWSERSCSNPSSSSS